MPETKRTLYRNWVKAGVGLLWTKEGLQEFVSNEINKFHTAIYGGVLQQLPPNSWCNTCTIQNVLRCPTPGTCDIPRCHFHDNNDPTKKHRPCPQKICQAIRDIVVNVHRYHKPNFKNSDAKNWYSKSWELAKCFMPPGYSNSSTADDTDFSGLINIVLCSMDFQAHITENLSQAGNIFEKARDARNHIMHNAKMEISTTDLNSYFQILMAILSDKQHIQNLPKAKEAMGKIQQLQQDLITITTKDEEKVRQESLELLGKVTEATDAIDIKRTEGIDDIGKKTSKGIEDIDIKKVEGAKHIETFVQEGIKRIDIKTEEGTKNIDERIEKGEKHIQEQTKEGALKILRDTEDCIKHIDLKTKEGTERIKRETDERSKQVEKETEERIRRIERQTKEDAQKIHLMIEEGTKLIDIKKEEGAQQIDIKAEERAKDIDRETEKGVRRIERETEEGKKHIFDKTDDGAEHIEHLIDDGITDIDIKTEEGVEHIDQKTEEGVNYINMRIEEGAKHIEIEAEERIKRIDKKTEQELQSLDVKILKGVEKININADQEVKLMDKKKEEGEKQIQLKTVEGVGNIHQTVEDSVQLIDQKTAEFMKKVKSDRFDEGINEEIETIYSRVPQRESSNIQATGYKSERAGRKGIKISQEERDLQKDVIEHYMEHGYCKSAMPALIEDEEVDVADLFVMPKLRIFKPGNAKAASCSKTEDSIRTISGLFRRQRQNARRVCIVGDAGLGKTMLCQKIVSYWCKLHNNQETVNLPECDQEFLKSYDFLFYIPLRNHTTSDVIEMIKNDIVRRHMHCLLDEVLYKYSEICLIVLDGLDEWIPPEGCKKKIPFLDPREKATVLITSRSWKLDALRPKIRDIGQKVELCGFTEELCEECITGIVEILNERRGERKKSSEIIPGNENNKVKDLMQIPIMLTQIVCMWYDNIDVGETRVKVYCKMFDYLLKLVDKRHHEEIEQNSEDLGWLEPKTTDNQCLLDIFKGLSFCENYSDLLYKLSDLAFHALFCEKKETSLVFPYSEAEIYNLHEEDIAFCLKAGLLSQTKFYTTATLRSKKLSFTHKTFQELLAALFIVIYGNDDRFIYMLQKVTSLGEVLEMSQVMLCIAGLRPDLVHPMCKHVSALGHADKNFTINYADDSEHERLGVEDFVKKISRLIIDLIQEGYYNGKEAPVADLDRIISAWTMEIKAEN